MGSVGVARFVFSTGSHSGILVTTAQKKTTPPLLFPTSVPFLTHVNFSRVFLRFYHSQGIWTKHPSWNKKCKKNLSWTVSIFSHVFFTNFQGKKKPGALLPQLWLRPPIPKNTHRGNFAVQRLGKRKAPCQIWLSQKCLTVRQWAVFWTLVLLMGNIMGKKPLVVLFWWSQE